MKTCFHSLMLSLMLAALAGPAAAQSTLAGTWQGQLEVAPGKTIAIQFVIAAKPDGGYTAIVTSPDEGAIKNVPASDVKYANDQLTLDVPALSGGYAGTMHNGVFEGEWSQEGAKLPLSLKPFEKPTLTKADIDALRGEWTGKLTVPTGPELTIVLRFSTGPDGALLATFDVPEQGVKDWHAENVVLDAGNFSVEMPKPHAKVTGKLKGSEIAGQWNQMGNSLPMTFKKGRYVAEKFDLKLPAEARNQLEGSWHGTLNGLTVIVRFETDAKGSTLGSFDSTQQNLLNLPINEATFAGTKLTFGLVVGAKFTGDLAGDKLTGEWTQPGLPKPLPLVLTREK